jgi:hypothetical protein
MKSALETPLTFRNPREELSALRRREVILSTQVDELSQAQVGMNEVGPMLDAANQQLSECREAIRQFKDIHKLANL